MVGDVLLDTNTNKIKVGNPSTRSPLCFPDPSEPIDFQCLTDETSPSIAKTCLQLCQKCTATKTAPIHPQSLSVFWKKAWNDGIQCLKSHRDRRCRILAAQMLAVTAKALYAMVRPNVLLLATRDSLTNSLEDDVLDVTSALIGSALEDPDDGVAAAALTHLGHVVLSNTTSFGGIFDDDESLPISRLDGTLSSPLAPTLRSVTCEDVAIPIQELQHRVMEQIVPRLLQLLHRPWHSAPTTWPILTQVIRYINIHYQPVRPSLDRETYSKRWTQLDGPGLSKMLYDTLLEPAMLFSGTASAAYTAAVCALRLGLQRVEASGGDNYGIIGHVLREAVSDDVTAVPALLIALRDVELSQRIRTLLWIATGNFVEQTMELWTELALHLVCFGRGNRTDCLRIFNTNEMPYEFRYALLEVTFQAGKRLYEDPDPYCDEWVEVAETVLETTSTENPNESSLNLPTAAATAYLHLRLLYLHLTGNLNAGTSIALRCSGDSPPHLLYDTLTNTASFLNRHDPLVDKPAKTTFLWKNQPEKNFFGWFLWALSVDQWIVAQQQELERHNGNSPPTLDVAAGKELIRTPHSDFARMGIAGLESIALVATEFRRRTGSTAETKMLVGAAIGMLKGIDEKAVARVQKCYEQGKAQPGNSELVMGNVKIKIKPLTSKVHRTLTDEEFQMATCRQRVAARLAVADGRQWGFRGPALNSHSVSVCSAPSDPCQLIVAYAPARTCRHDGAVEFRIQVTICVYNMTQFEINEGLRLEMALTSEEGDESSDWNLDFDPETPLFSRSTTCSEALKPGEYVTWEVDLSDIESSSSYQIVPSVVYMNVSSESEKIRWVATKHGEASTVGEQSNNGEDDFQVAASTGKLNDKVENVRLIGTPLFLPPMICMQPDPIIFVDKNGDVDTFRLLWFRAAYMLPQIHLTTRSENAENDPVTTKIARMARLEWEGEAVPDGFAASIWAFATLREHRVFVMQTTSNDTNASTLHIRGDDAQTLYSVCGSSRSRNSFVGSLLPGMKCT